MILAVVAAACLLPVLVVIGVAGFRAPLRVLLPAYAALVPFGSGITVPLPIPAPFNTLTTLAGAATMAVLGLHLVLGRLGPRRLLPDLPVWFLFLGVNAVTFLWSLDQGRTFRELVILTSLVGLYVLVVLWPSTRADADAVRNGIVAGGVLASLYGFFLLFTGQLPEEKAGLPRFATAGGVGDAADPNITAAVLVLPLVLAIAMAMEERRTSYRMAFGAGAAVVGAGIVLTASRGGVAAAVVAVAVLVAGQPHRLRIAIGAAVVVAVVGFMGSLAAPEQYARLFQQGSSGRTEIWRVGAVACTEHCAVGSGLGTFPVVHERAFLSTPSAGGVRIGEKPHNTWLGAAVETGIVSLGLLVAGFVLLAREVWRLPVARRAAPLAALAGLAVSNTFLGNLRFKYFWLVLVYAALVALNPVATPDEGRTDGDADTRLALKGVS